VVPERAAVVRTKSDGIYGLAAGSLTRKSHQLSAATGDAPHPTVFSRIGVLDVLQVRAPLPSGRKSRWAHHLAGLATKPGEICGLTQVGGKSSITRVIDLSIFSSEELFLLRALVTTPRHTNCLFPPSMMSMMMVPS
jgi:hypothetical protein